MHTQWFNGETARLGPLLDEFVEFVLLPDGWHNVYDGTFRIHGDFYSFAEKDKWTTDLLSCLGPVRHVVAVRVSGPGIAQDLAGRSDDTRVVEQEARK